MWRKIFLVTCFLILWNFFDVNALTVFGRKKLNETVETASVTPAKQTEPLSVEFEAFRTEVKTSLNEIKQLIIENEQNIKAELALITNFNDKTRSEPLASAAESIAATRLQNSYQNCEFALLNKTNMDGLYLLHFAPLAAFCQRFENKGWTIIYRRNFSVASADITHFHNWSSYRNGFGNLNGDHWLGLENIHQMTKDWVNELWLQLKFVDGSVVNLRNGYFRIGNESDGYKLEKGRPFGLDSDALGDILLANYEMKFSTYDKDNDNSEMHCARLTGFAWWYNKCDDESGLLGRKLRLIRTDSKGEESAEVIELAYIHMAIRIEDI